MGAFGVSKLTAEPKDYVDAMYGKLAYKMEAGLICF